MLRNRNPNAIESGQAAAVQNAGGLRLRGEFEVLVSGWQVTVSCLTFDELMRIVEVAKNTLEPR